MSSFNMYVTNELPKPFNVYVTNEMPKPFNVYVTNETPKTPESLVNVYSTYEEPNPSLQELPTVYLPTRPYNSALYTTQEFLSPVHPDEHEWVTVSHPDDDEWVLV